MRIVKQLSIFLENRPGLLAHACSTLGESDVNITAMTVHDMVDLAVVRLVADNPTKALLLLEEEDFYVIEMDVIILEMANIPGALANIARKLALADINIDYAYFSVGEGQKKDLLVLRTKENDRAMEALQGCEPGNIE